MKINSISNNNAVCIYLTWAVRFSLLSEFEVLLTCPLVVSMWQHIKYTLYFINFTLSRLILWSVFMTLFLLRSFFFYSIFLCFWLNIRHFLSFVCFRELSSCIWEFSSWLLSCCCFYHRDLFICSLSYSWVKMFILGSVMTTWSILDY